VSNQPNLLKSIAADSSLALVFRSLAIPLAFLANLAMARLYGAELMGTYYLAVNLILSISVFCVLGLNTGLLKFVATGHAEGPRTQIRTLFWPALVLVTLLGSAAAVALYALRDLLAGYLHSPFLTDALQFMVLALPIYVCLLLVMETVRALGGVRRVVFQQSILRPGSLLLLVVILAFLGPVVGPAKALPLAFLLSVLLALAFLLGSSDFRRTLFPLSTIDLADIPQSFGGLLTYSWPIFFNAILALSFNGLDSLILGLFTTPETVAFYNAAAKIAPLVMLPLMAVNAVVPPLFARFHQKGDLEGLGSIAQTTARWMYFLALPLALLLILLGPELLGFLGPEFRQARFALGVLALGQLVNVAAGSVGFILMMTGLQWTLLIFNIVIGLGTIPLMMVSAALFGLNGVAGAHALGLAGLNLLMAWGVWHRLRVKAYARKMGWANLGGLVGAGLFFLSKPYLGAVGAAILFSLGYLALVIRPFIKELQGVLKQPQWLEAP